MTDLAPLSPSGRAGAPASTPRLRLEGVGFSYGALPVLQNVDLQVADGEFVALLGLSGCGKSTLLKLVAGLAAPGVGQVSLDGRRIAGPHPRIGMVFQKPTLLPWRSVRNNILLPARFGAPPDSEVGARADRLIELVGLTRFAHAYPHQLSGGMAQRVGIARMLLHAPDVWLLDEPFSALDALTRESLSMDLQGIWSASRKMALFVTHSIPEAVLLADRIMLVGGRPGRIVAEARVDLPRPRTPETMAEPAFNRIALDLRRRLDGLAGLD